MHSEISKEPMEQDLIKDLADTLSMGLKCYIHKKTLRVISFPDPDLMFETDFNDDWKVEFSEVKKHKKEYIEIKKMTSYASFQIMENFTSTVENRFIRLKLEDILSKRKPFRNFNELVHQLNEIRQQWFDFNSEAEMKYVKLQLELNDIKI